MLKNYLIQTNNKNSNEINVNNSVLQFIKSKKNTENKLTQLRSISSRNSLIEFINEDLSKSKTISFFSLFNKKSLINSFECDNDSILGAGEYSFLIYSGQYLILYNIDRQLHKILWNTNINDTIKQIRWSSYYRSYLIMTARLFSLFTLFSYELIPIRKTFQSNEYLQLFTCSQTDLWLVCILSRTRKQQLVYYNLLNWEQNNLPTTIFSFEQLNLYQTDNICAIENDQNGEYLALLIAEKNEYLTFDNQRRRRLILITIYNMSPIKIISFNNSDDLYWTLTSVINRQTSKSGWLLTKSFNNEITFINNKYDDKLFCYSYYQEIRHLAITTNRRYLIIRTVNSLDIYQID